MSTYWSPIVHSLTPYVPGEQPRMPDLVKLNTNENPYGPGPAVLAAIEAANTDDLRLYPDPTALELRRVIAAYHGVAVEEVFVGNGSDEVLAHAFCALLRHERPLAFPDISYSFYPVYCGLYGIAARPVPLAPDFSIRVDDYLDPAIGAVIFPNPNAPTGMALPLVDIARLVAARPDIPVVVDEAYVDFGAESAVGLVRSHANLLVSHTLSKGRGLAGLRVGYAIGQAPLVEALNRVKDSFNSYPLDRLALAGAAASFGDEAWFQQTRRQVMATRETLVRGLEDLGFEVLPSAANFVFARHRTADAAQLNAGLRKKGVIVRHFARPERIANFLRITVGTEGQSAALLKAMTSVFG
ncbi:MAG: histidinol-phosphate transaminase [Rhodocyclaceae bacterium]|nr:histidinol-phosphate transaminase [Rhodocyclaceae bacterium]